MNEQPDKALLIAVAQEMGIDASVAEKDWWVTEVISVIAGIRQEGFQVVFSGGTCLSKAHSLLYRFSEDVDFRVLVKPELNKKSVLSGFKKVVIARLHEHGFKIQDEQITARNENRFFSIDLQYPTDFEKNHALRSHILIEMTVMDVQLPPHDLPVSSFLNQLARKPPEVASIPCIDPVENAADKLSAIAWRIPDRLRGEKHDDPSLVRHIHDLAKLKDRAIAHTGFKELVISSMQTDGGRAKNDPAINNLAMAEKFARMLKILDSDTEYPQEYERFVQGVSYAREGQTPSYVSAVEAVRTLVNTVLK